MFLAIDPGQSKCGWALVDNEGKVADRGIWVRDAVGQNLTELAACWRIEFIVLGNRTGHQSLLRELSACPDWQGRTYLAEEDRSSEEARRRWVRETTRGWRRFIPASLRHPTQPYDDYVAVILAERFLQSQRADRPCLGQEGPPGRRTHP